jgi:hypothetical protein
MKNVNDAGIEKSKPDIFEKTYEPVTNESG